jgi:hypothetical protein
VFTVARELGHSSTDMVEQVYAHLGTVRHRSEQVEYRVEQHEKALGDRLTALRTPAAMEGFAPTVEVSVSPSTLPQATA